MAKTIFEELGGRGITLSPALHYPPKRSSRLAYSGGGTWTI